MASSPRKPRKLQICTYTVFIFYCVTILPFLSLLLVNICAATAITHAPMSKAITDTAITCQQQQ